MPGFFPMSLQQQLDPRSNEPAVGAKLYFYAGGTTTPLTVFRDYALGLPHPNPITLDGYGRVPSVFLADDGSFYRARLVMADGTLAFDVDGLPVIGPTAPEGGGGDPGAPVDDRAVFKTGDMKARYDTGFHDGWLLCNGRSMGSALSGADYASADNEALFLHLWQKDANLVVAGGRGVSAAADWAANKTIALPDIKGKALFGLDSMGGSAAGRIPVGSITSPGGGVNVLGSSGGEGEHTLTTTEMPNHAHSATATQAAHQHTIGFTAISNVQVGSGGDTSLKMSLTPPASTGLTQPGIGVTVDANGGNGAHNNMPPFMLIPWYIKL